MHAVDTNVLVRLIARDHPEQVLAAQSFVAGGVWISHLVLAEALWVLTSTYGHSPGRIAEIVEVLLTHKDVAFQDSEAISAALDVYRKRPSLGFSDCLILEIARKAGHLPLGSFDRDLAKLPDVQRL